MDFRYVAVSAEGDWAMPMSRKPHYWAQACRELSRSDPVMKDLIRTYRGSHLVGGRDAFETLCRAVVGQQISVKAADSVWLKLTGRLDGISPQAVKGCRRDVLRRCGLSRGKTEYLKHAADFFVSRGITSRYWRNDIDTLRQEVLGIKGVGIWTFEMFAIFYLKHPDIFPVSDLGLVNAVNRLYSDGSTLPHAEIVQLGERWAPWRTVATWYLWRSIDPEPIVY